MSTTDSIKTQETPQDNPCPLCNSTALNRFSQWSFLADGPHEVKKLQCMACHCEAPETRWNNPRAAVIRLTRAEVQSGSDRQKWAEGLIEQLPYNHDGRNSWLMNYGVGQAAVKLRAKNGHTFNPVSHAINPPAAS